MLGLQVDVAEGARRLQLCRKSVLSAREVGRRAEAPPPAPSVSTHGRLFSDRGMFAPAKWPRKQPPRVDRRGNSKNDIGNHCKTFFFKYKYT